MPIHRRRSDARRHDVRGQARWGGRRRLGEALRAKPVLARIRYIVPWPDHMTMPHGGQPAHPQVPCPDDDIDMIVIDGEVFRAMARALEDAT